MKTAPNTKACELTSSLTRTALRSLLGRPFEKGDLQYLTHEGVTIWAYDGASEDFHHVICVYWSSLGAIIFGTDLEVENDKFLSTSFTYNGKTTYVIRGLFTPASRTALEKDRKVRSLFLHVLEEVHNKEVTKLRSSLEASGKSEVEQKAELVAKVTHRATSLINHYREMGKTNLPLVNYLLDLIQTCKPAVYYSGGKKPEKREREDEQETSESNDPAKLDQTPKMGASTSSDTFDESQLQKDARMAPFMHQILTTVSDLSAQLEQSKTTTERLEKEVADLKKDQFKEQSGFISLGNSSNGSGGGRTLQELDQAFTEHKEFAEGRFRCYSYQLTHEEGGIIGKVLKLAGLKTDCMKDPKYKASVAGGKKGAHLMGEDDEKD